MHTTWTAVRMLYQYCGTQNFITKDIETDVVSSDETDINYQFETYVFIIQRTLSIQLHICRDTLIFKHDMLNLSKFQKYMEME